MFDNPAFVGLIIAVPSFVLGYLGYRRSVKVDAIAQQSGIASQQIGAVGQVIDGLNKLVASLQDDNKNLRQDVIDLRLKYRELDDRYRILDERCEGLERDIRKLNGKHERGPTEAPPASVS